MSYLEASRTLAAFPGGPPLSFLFGLSGSSEPFDLYLKAAAAKRGRSATVRRLPFNTLGQSLRSEREPGCPEVFLLMPWDFVPEADWRSGIPEETSEAHIQENAELLRDLLSARGARLLYIPAPLPPLFSDPRRLTALAGQLEAIAISIGAVVLPGEAFSLRGYLSSGCPIAGSWLAGVAEAAVTQLIESPFDTKKVLVTDLDNVLWSGGIAEDGVDGIEFEAGGRGFPHFIYQTLLRRLRAEGVVLAAVSRNDRETALSAFRGGRMQVKEDDFVAIVASYNAKSVQVRELADKLNLGLDSFVFVDDNPIELAEVSVALPMVRCIPFPSTADGLTSFLSEVSALFARATVTKEDRQRTALYRRRLEGLLPSVDSGADIRSFLKGLGMTLTLHDRSSGERTRAIQLINKTNQFNLNGRRVTEQEVESIIHAGGRLIGASLSDRTGDHGEILACLVNPEGEIVSLVLSCRVFQRRVEYAFLAWLMDQDIAVRHMHWTPTARNEPFARFLRDVTSQDGAAPSGGLVPFDALSVRARFAADLELFTLCACEPVA